MGDAARLLAIERELERTFVREEQRAQRAAGGWSAALICFHLAQWRERLRAGFVEFQAGRTYTGPGNSDEVNDRELPTGRDLPLSQTSLRADQALEEVMALYDSLGEREFKWGMTNTTGDSIVRNSYFHPRVHIAAYWQENGDQRRAHQLLENTAGELRELWPSPVILGAGLYNLAGARVAQGLHEEAVDLLDEAAPMRPDILERAGQDPELAKLRGDPRFQELTGGPSGVESA
jgi:tetratricopeptide (TPR) repeat protein